MLIGRMMNRRTFRMALVAPAGLLLLAAAAACGGDDGDAKPTSTSGGGDGSPITIVLTDNVFTPKDIKVPVNTDVKITVDNKGTAVHNMHVLSKAKEGKDFASEALVNPGKTSTFEVEFTKKGKYDFQCDYHLPAMAGTITVE